MIEASMATLSLENSTFKSKSSHKTLITFNTDTETGFTSRALKVEESVLALDDCEFSSLHSDFVGGALQMSDSNGTISRSAFTYNSADQGGALSFHCMTTTVCALEVEASSSFEHNSAREGGFLYFNLFPPTLNNPTLRNNSAVYGADVGSYPAYIGIENETQVFSSLGSG